MNLLQYLILTESFDSFSGDGDLDQLLGVADLAVNSEGLLPLVHQRLFVSYLQWTELHIDLVFSYYSLFYYF